MIQTPSGTSLHDSRSLNGSKGLGNSLGDRSPVQGCGAPACLGNRQTYPREYAGDARLIGGIEPQRKWPKNGKPWCGSKYIAYGRRRSC